ncbi:MAG: phosphatidylserine decarboxylase family protein [Saprospiraceae bacterium]|nr:phosphatidylserine decarboxylase family protein [Saprospiraceae bacterium]
MYIHREGAPTLIISGILTAVFAIVCYLYFPTPYLYIGWVLLLGLYIFLISFFRNPSRPFKGGDHIINCPADGKIVVIEKTTEKEVLKKECMMVSIFMSPLNVHVNRNPVSGKVAYAKYHPGKYLAAWNPKASEENERTTIAYDTNDHKIVMRQVAGALARRIVFYVKENDEVTAGDEMGFIKFGSRVDLYLPLSAEIKVEINQMVRGNIDVIATL